MLEKCSNLCIGKKPADGESVQEMNVGFANNLTIQKISLIGVNVTAGHWMTQVFQADVPVRHLCSVSAQRGGGK